MIKKQQGFKRADRASDVLRQAVSTTLMTRFSHLGLSEVTVTEVKMTDDLKTARVFYRVFHQDKLSEIRTAFKEFGKQIQTEVGHQVQFRYTPILKFQFDESAEYGDKIGRLLDSIHLPAESEELEEE